ncbi:MAG: hypothetical protein EON50_00115 [Acidovorax sp.]|nr:MAG: hypothetical protein EON50_00115 [Acidovorax sp.]
MLALVLVRFLGLIGLLFGILWFATLLLAGVISAVGVPEWVTTAIWGYTAHGFLSGPLWFAAGMLLLKMSGPLSQFVAKGTQNDGV